MEFKSLKGFRTFNIKEEELSIGTNVVIEENVRVIGIGEEDKSIIIGDNVYIGEDVKLMGNKIEILDYTKLHNHSFLYAKKPLFIGYNCWIGQNVILNAEECLTIRNNVCISAYSQLWTHIKFGDTLEGCRFHSYKKMEIDDDVWLGGNCIVAPIHARRKSMALAGSVIVRDMEENHIYAGEPAKDMTDRLGPQFEEIRVEEKYKRMKEYLAEFLNGKRSDVKGAIEIVMEYPGLLNKRVTYFNVSERTYTKRNTKIEWEFMHYLLPQKAKFIPVSGV